MGNIIEEDSPDEDIALWYGLDQPEFDPYGDGPEFEYRESSAGRIVVKNLPVEGATQTRDEERRPARIIDRESGADIPLCLHNGDGELIATINAVGCQGYRVDSRGDWIIRFAAGENPKPGRTSMIVKLDCSFVRAFNAAVLTLERAACSPGS